MFYYIPEKQINMEKFSPQDEVTILFVDMIDEGNLDEFLQLYSITPKQNKPDPEEIIDAMIACEDKCPKHNEIICALLNTRSNRYNKNFLRGVVEYMIYCPDNVLVEIFATWNPWELSNLLSINLSDFILTYLQHDHKTTINLVRVAIMLKDHIPKSTFNRMLKRFVGDDS